MSAAVAKTNSKEARSQSLIMAHQKQKYNKSLKSLCKRAHSSDKQKAAYRLTRRYTQK